MQITEDKTIEVEQNADRLADFIMFAQRSFLLDLSKELNKGNISYAQFFLLGYLANDDFLTMTDISKKKVLNVLERPPYRVNMSSRILGSGHSSSSTINSNLSKW